MHFRALLSSERQLDESCSHHADVSHSCAPCGSTRKNRGGSVAKGQQSQPRSPLQLPGLGSSCPHSRAGTFVLLLPHQRVMQPSANPTQPRSKHSNSEPLWPACGFPYPSVGTYFIFLLSCFNPGCWGIVELLHLSALNKLLAVP